MYNLSEGVDASKNTSPPLAVQIRSSNKIESINKRARASVLYALLYPM